MKAMRTIIEVKSLGHLEKAVDALNATLVDDLKAYALIDSSGRNEAGYFIIIEAKGEI